MEKVIFSIYNGNLITISAKFAKQRFLCSESYSAGVCHGACCSGPSVVLLTEREAADLKKADESLPVYGRVLAIRGKHCPLALPNGHCKYYGTPLKSFVCTIMPFCLNKNGLLIIDNGFMKRSCRVRNDKEGGQPAYRCFNMALVAIFGEELAQLITEHFDNDGGDISVPVKPEILETLLWHRGVIDDIKKFGYKETITKLAGGIECL